LELGIPIGSLEALVGIDAALGDMPDEMDLDFTGGKLEGFWIR
jgi:hypothetical protein